jgi:NAD(P)-dependent dehydrogenase (short-subunit alcohol dehydrogenase family)
MRLAGKVAIVTGATGGIGASIVDVFAAEGAKLVLGGTRVETTVPDGATYLHGDVSDEGYAARLVDTAIRDHGRLDVLVNSHGLDFHSDIESTPIKGARRVLEVNVLGVLSTMKYAVRAMQANGGGSVVNLSSRLGQVAIPGQAVYSASKGAVIMLSRGAAIDLARSGIRVNVVAPGITATNMIDAWVQDQPDPAGFRARLEDSIPMGRMATPREIALAVLFLASDDASHVTGVVLPVDGGYTAA